jgi:cold shock protein
MPNHSVYDCLRIFTGTDINVREGELVWYNERKGYGFFRIGDTEVFLQRSTLDRFGLVRLFTGDKVTVSLTVNKRGEVIQDLLRVERPINPAPPAESELEDVELRAVVKFFNGIRGYGFVTPKDIAEDVLVHSRVLNDCGVHSLIQGQKLLIKVDDTGKRPQVQALQLLNE